MLERVKEIAGLLRDLGVIIGVATIVAVGLSFYDLQHKANEAQVKALEAQNSILKETQFDRVAQKKAYEIERANTAREISQLEKKLDESSNQYSENLQKLRSEERECLGKVVAKLRTRFIGKQSDDTEDKILILMADAAKEICM
jgi:uncharacterized protein HemX